MSRSVVRRRRGRHFEWGLALVAGLVAIGVLAGIGHGAPAPATTARLAPVTDDTLFGRSGKLRARLLGATTGKLSLEYLARLFGRTPDERPGIYQVQDSSATRTLSLIRLLPFSQKRGAHIGTYTVGFWPGERRAIGGAYANPDGFIEVTRDNQDTRVSEHFRLRDFLTKDQRDVWPKYLVLREELIDKLELVIAELERTGHPVERMVVMSGFRTPRYNANGGSTGGRSDVSRHMYGDAADVFVDNDGNGRMDDLNGDRRVDHRDARVILEAAERVERRHGDLVGGVGVYRAAAGHGPFAHIDVRGRRARWGLL
ncbi:MAG TPA: D-Ala-D-Ala carboxypeptidase family metallohydrolase [Gemmatimonadaceae bacterium]|nr:D-Ala-D-Ala carboxypeptidase family metallohydrolase [Gemmatimonadaceae bacterium]